MPDLRLSTCHKNSTPPCKDCSDRCVGCHSTCAKYTEWAKNATAEREAKRSEYIREGLTKDFSITGVMKRRKGLRKWTRRRR